MPPSLRNRAADNWRILLSIADDLGHGEDARAAAIALCANRPDEDPGVILLNDIRVFDTMGVDRISSLALVEALHAIEDGLWLDWRGPNDDRPPRKLNQSETRPVVAPIRDQAKDDMAGATSARRQELPRLLPLAIRGGVVGVLLGSRHTDTRQQNH